MPPMMHHHSIDLPRTPAEADAFVAAVKGMPEAHAHGGHGGMSREHMRLLELVDRSDASHVAIAEGDWFDPATWHRGRIPGADAKVLIPDGVEVTYDGVSRAALDTVRVDGELSFATNTDTRMVVDTFVVAPTGRLEIGTANRPVQANVDAEIVIANNGNIDVSWDPLLQSRGLISHGEVEIHGAEKTTFLKVDAAPMAGDRQIRLEDAPEGWQVGDTIVLTGTHKQGWGWDNNLRRVVHRDSQDEEVTITGINGNRVTIDRPLQHDHDAPRGDLGAYVSNMSRNITVRSEDGDATQVHHRGHVMFMHSDDVDVRYAAFDDLGRTDKSFAANDAARFSSIEADTNVKGRYALHLHRTGTEDQDDPTYLVGNAVSGSPGWGIAHHSSHAIITDNAVYGAFGAAFAAEDGDETGIWDHNIAINSAGTGWGESSVKLQSDLPRHDNGRTGDGFFFAGRLVEASDNVAANTTHGFVWMHRSAPADPLADNLDHSEIAHGRNTIRHDKPPIQGFRDNEAFGTEVGLIVVKANHRQEHDVRTIMDGFVNWETANGVDLSYTSHYTVKDVDLVGARRAPSEFGYRLGSNAYDMVVNGLEIEGFGRGVDLTGNDFTFPATNGDVGQVFIDVDQSRVGTEFAGFNPARHRVMSSDNLAEGRLDFDIRGDLRISQGETLVLNGTKTDSIGSRDRQFDSVDDVQRVSWGDITALLRDQGYNTTPDGQRILLLEDLVADRATGELLKISHPVRLDIPDAQLQNLGATNNGTEGTDKWIETHTDKAPKAAGGWAVWFRGLGAAHAATAEISEPTSEVELTSQTEQASAGAAPEPVVNSLDANVLFVGHSLVNNRMPAMLRGFIEQTGGAGSVHAHIIIGSPLWWSWKNASKAEQGGFGVNAREHLPQGQTDVLVLTEGVPHPTRPEAIEGASNFYNLAIDAKPDTQVYMYETWHDLRSGTAGYDVDYDPEDHIPWRERLDHASSQWREIVDAVNAQRASGAPEMKLVPAGRVMARMHDEIEKGNSPGLDDIRDLFKDDIHLTDTGNYMIAIVHYMTIFGRIPDDVALQQYNQWGEAFDPPSAELAAFMKDIAWDEVTSLYPFGDTDQSTTKP